MSSPLTKTALRAWLKSNRPLGLAVIAARAFAAVERARVDAYILPIFARYAFTVAPENQTTRDGAPAADAAPEAITDPKNLYLASDAAVVPYFAECADAHAAHGWTGGRDYNPASVADYAAIKAENALLSAVDSLLPGAKNSHGKIRRDVLELMLNACVNL